MAKKLNNVEEIEETEKAEETEVETKPEGLAAKVKDGVKKHGKKVAIGANRLEMKNEKGDCLRSSAPQSPFSARLFLLSHFSFLISHFHVSQTFYLENP